MSTITNFFEQEVIKKIQAKNTLDKKLEESRLGFNKGISYLENLCEQLQEHIPTLGYELKVNENKTIGHFILDANNCRIPFQIWGKYDESGVTRAGFYEIGQEFIVLYKSNYWRAGESFEKLLIKDIVNNLNLVQMQ
jgi:hypothetical protein